MRQSSARAPLSPAMLGLLLLGVGAIGAWYWSELQPVPVAAIPPVADTDPGEARTPGRMARFDLPTEATGEPDAPPASQPIAETGPAAGQPPPPADAGLWEEEIARYEALDRDAPPPPGSILLLGASNIRMWDTLDTDFAGLSVVNRGVGGCRLSELALFAPRLLRNASPGVIVVSAGSNDINAGAEPEEVPEAFRLLLAAIRHDHPDVPVLFLGILPAKSRWEQRRAQEQANGLVKALIEAEADGGSRVAYLDVSQEFLGADGLPAADCFLEDDLHPSALGNARRAARMRPVLERLRGETGGA